MHQLEVKPSSCSCILNPLLREAEIVPARGLPFPNGLDAASVAARAAEQTQGVDGTTCGAVSCMANSARRFSISSIRRTDRARRR